MARRVVITACGIVSALGHRFETILENFDQERDTFNHCPFDAAVSIAPVRNFDLQHHAGRFKESRYLNRGAALGVAAAVEALRNANFETDMPLRTGVFTGCGPNFDLEAAFPEIGHGCIDTPTLPALWILKYLPNTMASIIAKQLGLHGENLTVGTACSASLQAIGEAYRKIKDGYLDLAFAGGGDSRINPGGILAYKKARAINQDADIPGCASRPFDMDAGGFAPGEGGAFLLLETFESAVSRGAPIMAEIFGFGASMDGVSLTAPEPAGKWAEAAVRGAIGEAGLVPAQIDLISAHGTGTLLNDTMEANLIHRIFNGATPLVLAFKSWIGHLAAACGAVETALLLCCLQHQYFPKIRNLESPRLSGLNYAFTAQKGKYKTALIENFGFGGQNAALVLKKWV